MISAAVPLIFATGWLNGRVARFFLAYDTKTGKMDQMTTNYAKRL
jgi:hypothetical protein